MIDTEPKSAADAVAAWDRGETLWTIEMGGLGPGYEQAIQTATIEILRDHANDSAPTKENYGAWGNDSISRIDERLGGLTGAMVGAAKHLAFRAIRDGWANRNDKARKQFENEKCEDRMIQVSRSWPVVPK